MEVATAGRWSLSDQGGGRVFRNLENRNRTTLTHIFWQNSRDLKSGIMAPRGRPRTPDAIKLATGTWRKDRDGDPGAVVPSEGVPERPADVTGDARKLWESIVPGLIESGVATARDTTTLAEMCQWYKRYRKVAKELDRTRASNPYYKDLLSATKWAWAEFDKIGGRFGLTPADRARLKVESPKKSSVPKRARG